MTVMLLERDHDNLGRFHWQLQDGIEMIPSHYGGIPPLRCQIIHTATIVWDPRNCGGIGEGAARDARPFVSTMHAAAIRGTSLQFDRIPREITLHYVPTA